MLARIQTISTAVVTWLTVAGAVAAIVADELVKAGVDGSSAGGIVLRGLAVLLVVTGTAVSIIRRVTPVLPQERGVLPQPFSGT